jgi:RecB family endonuclease NucS
MYLIDKQKNRIKKIKQVTFSELGFRERGHLQEWLEANPEALGEDFLIIQKEFSGFNDTNERLDLLALDKRGNAVIIENKLDDTGRDVTWQALKYSSYCSTLVHTRKGIKRYYQLLYGWLLYRVQDEI